MDDSWFWIVLLWAMIFFTWLWSRRIEREIKSVEKDVQIILDKILFMRVEKHNDLMFAYDASSGDFVCQGNSMEELNTNFGIRYPDRRGIIVEAEETPDVL